MRVSDKRIMSGFFRVNGMSAKQDEIMSVLSTIPECGAEKARRRLIDELKMLPCKAENVMDIIAVRGDNSDIIFGLERYIGLDNELDEGIASVKSFISAHPDAEIELLLWQGSGAGLITAEN